MQFVKKGPDVPDRLLQAHEDGNVVFFCGAGISAPAGLPNFGRLVKQLYEHFQIHPDPLQRRAIKASQYDMAMGLLESGVMGGRQRVREVLAGILLSTRETPDATATHRALLTLARNRENQIRLVTTNFDRLFEKTIEDVGASNARGTCLSTERFSAPLLPVPKNRWHGLVYLHGLLPEHPSSGDLERLVVSSGDFGLAYLAERWAARFVSELFRNYTVCFVGYSLNDPVLRYMMDALAADRLLGESPPEMFAFGSYSKGKESNRAAEWRAKNVTPILYKEHWRHAYLHRTLRTWSETYRDGVEGKEQVVVRCVLAGPLASTEEDDFGGRLLWALGDPSGVPARRFAEFDPVPSLDWLTLLTEERFGHADLKRFGVTPNAKVDESLKFSLTRRPPPYYLAHRMALVDWCSDQTRWDNVMAQIANWLMRHLDDPALLLWLASQGESLHQTMATYVALKMKELDELERNGDNDALDRIRANAPMATPSPEMRKLWDLFLAGRVRSSADGPNLYGWCDRFNRDGLTATLRLELCQHLAPRVSLHKPFPRLFDDEGQDVESDAPGMSKLVRAELVLSAGHVRVTLRENADRDLWVEALPNLLPDFTGLLRDALDLWSELGYADDTTDQSFLSQPSISAHSQNREHQDWTPLIELTRDAWLATSVKSPEDAKAGAEAWWRIPYPVFRRLAYFAATHREIIPLRQALHWLLADRCWWLWSPETLREAMRLLVALAPRLEEAEFSQLERAILAGPPRDMYKAELEPESWERIQDRDIWQRLAKVSGAGATLSMHGTARLESLSARHPKWQLAKNERDEFSTWMGDGSDWHEFVTTPRETDELLEWLKADEDVDARQRDDWSDRCRQDFDTIATALSQVAQEGIWPTRPWRKALQAWSEESKEKLIERSWAEMASVLSEAPGEVLHDLSHHVSWWLGAVAKTSAKIEEAKFFSFCDRVLALDDEDEDESGDPAGRAINHPVGLVTNALLQWWYRGSLRDGQGLADPLNRAFTRICDTKLSNLRHGRVLLATSAIALFRVDPDWTTKNLLPLFEWKESPEQARLAWVGFLRSPRLYRPFLDAVKHPFLETAQHYTKLGPHKSHYSSLLTFAALHQEDVFTIAETRQATAALPQEGLDDAARTLLRGVRGAGSQAADYWRNRAIPYLRYVWPKTASIASMEIADSFARACVEAQEAFPEALERVKVWLQALTFPGTTVDRLHELNIHERFPDKTLTFLDKAIAAEVSGPLPNKLRDCLHAIRTADPHLESDPRFRRLVEYLRVHGQDLD